MNNKDSLIEKLRTLGLGRDEATLYLELLRGPSTHLKLAHGTGINRTKVYRLADELEKRSLITKRTDDRGTFLVASDPSTLEVVVVAQEERLQNQQAALAYLLPALAGVKAGDTSNFVIHTYDGEEGFKQMLWHELKTKGECLVFGSGSIGRLVGDEQWGEKHRSLTVSKAFVLREILNPGSKDPIFTLNTDFIKKHYSYRLIDPKILPLQQQTVIYNDTVAIYNWRQEQKVGIEIISKDYAQTMRTMFEHFWKLARDPS